MQHDIQLTERGREKLEEKIKELEARLSTVRSRKGEASDIGGNAWHDNSDFEELEMQERILMTDIADLKNKIQHSTIHNSSTSSLKISISSKVQLRYIDSGKTIDVEIVGHGEGDPINGLIAYDSLLGDCILGARKNDTRTLTIDDNRIIIKIESID